MTNSSSSSSEAFCKKRAKALRS
ncbi:MAG: hypothetical protein CISAcid_16540 [uncultured Acidilobus sp. CIS]|jgi:hypothetical protein|nr:MAG: hypothetical protein CISAcid_16540 [uncultured Acidilobus sp. CIS]ESQ25273.1 MAG: hypothetical protein OSP8Acid_09310 [uncultured Acidilobus sp. OSP8]